MLDATKSFYNNTKACVTVDDKLGEFFETGMKERQDCDVTLAFQYIDGWGRQRYESKDWKSGRTA